MDPVVQVAVVTMVGAVIVAIVNGVFMVIVARLNKPGRGTTDEDAPTSPKRTTRRRRTPDA